MTNLGLHDFAARVAPRVLEAARGKKSADQTIKRVITEMKPALEDAYFAGMDQASIVVRDSPDAVKAIVARKDELVKAIEESRRK